MVHLPPPVTAATADTTTDDNIHRGTAIHDDTGTIKPATSRTAVARCLVHFSNPTALRLISTASLKKGDVLSVARIAGIMAAKKTADLVPLCHNIPLSGVSVELFLKHAPSSVSPSDATSASSVASDCAPKTLSGTDSTAAPTSGQAHDTSTWNDEYESEKVGEFGAVAIEAKVHTFGQTGVEMEALMAASAAGLTVYDMCKAVDKGMRIDALRVVLKTGGRSGTWVEPTSASHT